MTIPVVIVGAGGFGRHTLAIIKAINKETSIGGEDRYTVVGFIDDGSPDPRQLSRVAMRHLGGISEFQSLPKDTRYCIGIGSGHIRRRVDESATKAGLTPLTLVHPDATIGPDVRLGAGTIICAGARLTDNIETGRHVHVNMNCTIGHDAVLGEYSSVWPQAAISGNVLLGPGVTVGASSCVNQELRVGAGAFVASGASVIRDVSAYTLVAGVPAVVKKTNLMESGVRDE